MQQPPIQRLPPGSRPPPPQQQQSNGTASAPANSARPNQPTGQPYSIPPSHPSHPQHQAWLHQQQLQQAQAGPPGPHYHQQQQQGPPPIRIQTSLPPHASPSSASAPPSASSRPPPSSGLPPGSGPPPQRPPLPPSYPSNSSAVDGRGPPQPPMPPQGYRPDGMVRGVVGAGVGPGRAVGVGGQPGVGRQDLALAASLAAQGHGPLTATSIPVGPGLSKLTAFNEALSIAFEQPSPLPSLRTVVSSYFTETAVLKYGLYDPGAGLNKVFEIPISSLPRFLHIHALQQITHHTLSPSFIREFALSCPDPSPPPPPPNPRSPAIHVGYLLRADEATWHSRFEDGSKVELSGVLTVHFVVVAPSSPTSPVDGGGAVGGQGGGGLRIESMEFEARGHEEFVAREAVVRERVVRWFDEAGFSGLGASTSSAVDEGAGGEGSPKQGAGGKKFAGALTRRRSAGGASASSSSTAATADPPATPTDPSKGHKLPLGSGDRWSTEERVKGLGNVEGVRELRGSVGRVGSFGITEMGMRCLEIAESVAQLHELIGFSLETGLGPLQSLTRYSSSLSSFPPAPPPLPPLHAPTSNPQAPIASTSQNPQTNPFYASSTVPPPPLPTSSAGPGGGGEEGVPPSPGGKRKAGGPPGGGPPRTPTPGLGGQQEGGEGFEPNGGTPGSPKKVARGNGGGAAQATTGAQGRGARNRRG